VYIVANMSWTPNLRMGIVALTVLALDQMTKWAVMKYLVFRQEVVLIEGFFRLVYWGNTGAAWSFFKDHNSLLALVSSIALVVLYLSRYHFGAGTVLGQVALGLLFGGIMGNLTDRLLGTRRHVIDFLYFYVNQRGGGEIGFPAFNLADSAICIGVALLFFHSLQREQVKSTASSSVGQPSA
jgi:signal peptidase II